MECCMHEKTVAHSSECKVQFLAALERVERRCRCNRDVEA